MAKKLSKADIRKYQEKVRIDPVKWAKESLNVELWSKQVEILEAIRDNNRVVVRSSNAVGKSLLSAVAALWFSEAFSPSYVVLTSSSWRGVEKTLFPEIAKLHLNSRIPLGGEMLNVEWKRSPNWRVFGVSADKAENFAGFRSQNGTFVIVDEASALDNDIMEAISGLCAGANSKILLIGNPLRPSGPFYNAFSSPLWKKFSISAFESPNVLSGKEIIRGLATKQWAEEMKNELGENSPAYKARVLGEFPSSSDSSLVSLDIIERSIKDKFDKLPNNLPVIIGVDIARYGSDSSVILTRKGSYVIDVQKYNGISTMELTGHIVKQASQYSNAVIFTDDGGVGGGVSDRLFELKQNVIPVNNAQRAISPDNYANARAECYWNVRNALEKNELYFDEHTKQAAYELSNINYMYNSSGKLLIEAKTDIKKRIGKSPDLADALALTFAAQKKEIVRTTEWLVVEENDTKQTETKKPVVEAVRNIDRFFSNDND